MSFGYHFRNRHENSILKGKVALFLGSAPLDLIMITKLVKSDKTKLQGGVSEVHFVLLGQRKLFLPAALPKMLFNYCVFYLIFYANLILSKS